MKKVLKFLGYTIGVIISIVLLAMLYMYIKSSNASSTNMALLGKEAPTLTVDGFTFRDLNKNGKLDVYEDSRAPLSNRIDDLTNQMNVEEKAGLMFITMALGNEDGYPTEIATVTNPFSLMLEAPSSMIAKKKMNHFNAIQSHTPEAMIAWHNNLQKMAERTRLGIPITLATDPRHGLPPIQGISLGASYYSKWCSPPGLAAIGDTVLAREFGDIARQELLALGFRVTLSPQADLATEPRWARISGTFGEEAELAAKLTKAYILGFQGDSITTKSVECMPKHFTGNGPVEKGLDSHFPPGRNVYPGNNFNYHLIPFEKGVFTANVAQIMPCYSIPVGQSNEEVSFGYNKQMITGLLREKYKFDGIITTDWGIVSDTKIAGMMFKPASAYGVDNLNIKQRVAKIIDAGNDMIGGEALPEVVIELVKSGEVSEERINTSIKRILKEKFRLGLFDNPYLSKENTKILGNKQFFEKGLESQRRSLTLLKNDNNTLPLKAGIKVYLQGFDAAVAAKFPNAVAKPQDADMILLKLKTPAWGHEGKYLMEKLFPQGRLDFPEPEKTELLKLIQSKPTITVMTLDRPTVFPEINANSKAVIADFNSQDEVILDLIFGKFKPTGKLPFELPSSMEAVEKQKEDVPFDSENPLYRFGYGIGYN